MDAVGKLIHAAENSEDSLDTSAKQGQTQSQE